MKQIDTEMIDREVRYAFDFHSRSGGWKPLASSIIPELVGDITTMAAAARPLGRGETGVISWHRPKTAALIADRVWLQFPGQDVSLDFAFGWESPLAVRLGALFALIQASDDPPPGTAADVSTMLTGRAADFVLMTEGALAKDYSERAGASVAPLFESTERRDAIYSAGDYPAVVSVVAKVAMVEEDALSWSQVLEFRSDDHSRRSYRRFVHWLDRDMLGRSVEYIVDELNGRLTAYDAALRKHGIRTALGTFERTLSARSLVGAGTAAAALNAVTAQPLWALLAGAGTMIGHAAVHIGTTLLAREEIVEANADVAFVHRVKRIATD